jgi:hypothetical protein
MEWGLWVNCWDISGVEGVSQCYFDGGFQLLLVLTKPWDLRTYLSINVTGGLVLTKPCDLRTYLGINVTCGLVLTKPCDLRTYLGINVTWSQGLVKTKPPVTLILK